MIDKYYEIKLSSTLGWSGTKTFFFGCSSSAFTGTGSEFGTGVNSPIDDLVYISNAFAQGIENTGAGAYGTVSVQSIAQVGLPEILV